MDPDPDPRGPKTCGSGGSGFGSGSATLATQATVNTKATGSYSVHDSSRTVCQACRSLRFTLLKHLIKETGSQDRTEIF